MSPQKITVHVPASTSNIGPGFDCIGLALDIWNETVFSFDQEGRTITSIGYIPEIESEPEKNLVFQAFSEFCRLHGSTLPENLHIHCTNRIPIGAGLGSSAAATLTGLLAANAWLGANVTNDDLLKMALSIEGHPDNSAPSIFGGLVGISADEDAVCAHNFPIAPWNTVILIPQINLPTKTARKILPETILRKDAIFNIGHAILVMQALAEGNEALLQFAMKDRLHQPYRIPLITGSDAIIKAAEDAGAAAGLSGAGPGIIAFTMSDTNDLLSRMVAAAESFHLKIETLTPKISCSGASVMIDSAIRNMD